MLLLRGARGVELTPAGRAFLDHARLLLLQVEMAGEAARRATVPDKTSFALGFLTGYEIEWLAPVMRILRDELPRRSFVGSSTSRFCDLNATCRSWPTGFCVLSR